MLLALTTALRWAAAGAAETTNRGGLKATAALETAVVLCLFSITPAIATVTLKDRSGTTTAAGAVALDIPGTTSRRGAGIAGLSNTGLITVTMKNIDGTTHAA